MADIFTNFAAGLELPFLITGKMDRDNVPDLKSRHLKNFLVVIIFENRQ